MGTDLEKLLLKIERLTQGQLQTKYLQSFIGSTMKGLAKEASEIEKNLTAISITSKQNYQKVINQRNEKYEEDLSMTLFANKMQRWGSALDKVEMFRSIFDGDCEQPLPKTASRQVEKQRKEQKSQSNQRASTLNSNTIPLHDHKSVKATETKSSRKSRKKLLKKQAKTLIKSASEAKIFDKREENVR